MAEKRISVKSNPQQSSFHEYWCDYLMWQNQIMKRKDNLDLNFDGFIWPFLKNGSIWKTSEIEVNDMKIVNEEPKVTKDDKITNKDNVKRRKA